MPDWDITLNITNPLRRGDVYERVFVIENTDSALATAKGLEVALTSDDRVPPEAQAFWLEKRNIYAPWEILTELQNKWNITFGCRQHSDIELVTPTPPIRLADLGVKRPSQLAMSGGPNDIRESTFDLDAFLGEQAKHYLNRQKELLLEREKIEREYAANEANLTRIQAFFITNGKAKPGRSKRSALQQPQSDGHSRKDLSGVSKSRRRVGRAKSRRTARGGNQPLHEHGAFANGNENQRPAELEEVSPTNAAIFFEGTAGSGNE